MFKQLTIVISGMVSMFNATHVLQHFFYDITPVVLANDSPIISVEGIANLIRQDGMAVIIGIFSTACLFFGVKLYYREMKERERKLEEKIKSQDEALKKLLDDNISLSKEVAMLREKNASRGKS
jgi:hypothetical protein